MLTDKNKAIYLQIADRICDDILEGRSVPGGRLLSVREYAASVEVNANTVMRSYDYLANLGIISNRRGIGYFVEDEGPAIVRRLRTRELLEDEIYSVFRRLAQLQVSPQELMEIYTKYLNDNKTQK